MPTKKQATGKSRPPGRRAEVPADWQQRENLTVPVMLKILSDANIKKISRMDGKQKIKQKLDVLKASLKAGEEVPAEKEMNTSACDDARRSEVI